MSRTTTRPPTEYDLTVGGQTLDPWERMQDDGRLVVELRDDPCCSGSGLTTVANIFLWLRTAGGLDHWEATMQKQEYSESNGGFALRGQLTHVVTKLHFRGISPRMRSWLEEGYHYNLRELIRAVARNEDQIQVTYQLGGADAVRTLVESYGVHLP